MGCLTVIGWLFVLFVLAAIHPAFGIIFIIFMIGYFMGRK